ncbi:g11885 [Coccomyxa viridis]|uniref:GrpE protein homolog n=1 Tax=Coccomyxa viridis TaxID=1274662 RepID=A0ABP1G905_9CHLO
MPGPTAVRRAGSMKAAAKNNAAPEPMEKEIPVQGPDDERPAAPAEDAANMPTAGEDEADGASTSEIMDMIEELVEEAGTSDQSSAEEAEEQGETLKAEVASLSAQLRQSEEALKASQERYLRLTADFDNFRKRSTAEKAQLTDKTKADTIRQLLAVVDSFEMAKGQLKPESEGEKKIDGSYQGVYKQMVEAFRSLGVEAVPGPGNIFDPEVHEAIMREENDDLPDGTVLQEFRRGFRLGNQLLRAAMVQVSFTDKPSPPAANGSNAGEAPTEETLNEPAAQESETQ